MSGASSPASLSPSEGSQATTLIAGDVSVKQSYEHPHKTAKGLQELSDEEVHAGSIRTYVDEDLDDDAKSFGDSRKDSLETNLNTDDLPLLTAANALPVEDEERLAVPGLDTQHAPPPKAKPVSWMSLPRKDQLAILVLARLSEPVSGPSAGNACALLILPSSYLSKDSIRTCSTSYDPLTLQLPTARSLTKQGRCRLPSLEPSSVLPFYGAAARTRRSLVGRK